MADMPNVAPNAGARAHMAWTSSNTTRIDYGKGFRKSGTVSQEFIRLGKHFAKNNEEVDFNDCKCKKRVCQELCAFVL